MGKYINWDDVNERYNRLGMAGKGAKGINSAYIVYAEAQIEGALAKAYTVPFSSNNTTIRDLCIDATIIKAGSGISDTKIQAIKTDLTQRINDLLNGVSLMVTDSGDVLGPSSTLHGAWSTTKDYHPTFGMLPAYDLSVSSERLDDEVDARS